MSQKPHTLNRYLIGEASKRSGVSAANIRFYEKEGLIEARGDPDNGYRIYSDSDLHQLRFIRQLRSLNMNLNEVRSLMALDLGRKRDCASARSLLDTHVASVGRQIQELRRLESTLIDLRKRCDGQGVTCKLIEALHERADSDFSFVA
jgi:DNA-binding transcriptional MerR regulator